MIPDCDRQTVRRSDGQTESTMAKTALCIASYADALSKMLTDFQFPYLSAKTDATSTGSDLPSTILLTTQDLLPIHFTSLRSPDPISYHGRGKPIVYNFSFIFTHRTDSGMILWSSLSHYVSHKAISWSSTIHPPSMPEPWISTYWCNDRFNLVRESKAGT